MCQRDLNILSPHIHNIINILFNITQTRGKEKDFRGQGQGAKKGSSLSSHPGKFCECVTIDLVEGATKRKGDRQECIIYGVWMPQIFLFDTLHPSNRISRKRNPSLFLSHSSHCPFDLSHSPTICLLVNSQLLPSKARGWKNVAATFPWA